MTPKFSLIVGVAVTALAFCVPTAFGQGQLVGPSQPDAVAYFYANERATLGFEPFIHDHGDATQAKLQLQAVDAVTYFYANERATVPFGPVIHDHGDATPAKLQLQSPPMEVIRDHGDATQAKLVHQRSSRIGSRDQVRLDPIGRSTPMISATSGSEIEWPQLGVGFGVGILLVGGLWLAMRITKRRALAH